MSDYNLGNTLGAIDPGLPVNGASLEELVEDLRLFKEAIKNWGLVSHTQSGELRGGDDEDSGPVQSGSLAEGSVTESKIATNAVITRTLGPLVVTSEKIANLAVGFEKLGDKSVGSSKLKDSSVTAAKIANGAVESGALYSGNEDTKRPVRENSIADLSVTDRAVKSVSVEKLLADGVPLGSLVVRTTDGFEAVNLNQGSLVFNAETNQFEFATVGGVVKVADVKNNGTHGGDGTSGVWNERDLGEVSDENSYITFAGNIFSLEVGTYLIDLSVPAFGCGKNKSRLKRIVGANETQEIKAYGGSVVANKSGSQSFEVFRKGDETADPPVEDSYETVEVVSEGQGSVSRLTCVLEVTDSTHQYLLEHWIEESGGNGWDFGKATNVGDGVNEVYVQGTIEKV